MSVTLPEQQNTRNLRAWFKDLSNLDKVEKVLAKNEANSHIVKVKYKEPYKCKACVIYGRPDAFISSDDKEINEHMMKHLETSNKVSEPSLDESYSSDIYEGFDEDGNRIAVIESEEEE